MSVFSKLEAQLIQHITLLRDLRTCVDANLKYVGIEDIVLRHGVTMRRDVVGERKVKRGKPRECFGNAGHLVARYPDRYIYCEGYAIADKLPIAIHHGWVYDTETGMVIDPTWGLDKEVCYVGVAFTRRFVHYCYQEFGYYSLLDYPAITKWAIEGFPDYAFATISPKL